MERGAAEVLAAIKVAGGADALADADPAAAMCLCHALMQEAPPDMRPQVAGTFTLLGPAFLAAAAADVRQGAPCSTQRACTAGMLANAFMELTGDTDQLPEQLRRRFAPARQFAKQVA